MKKKIIIIGSAHPLRGGGITTFNHRLAQELQLQGYDVEIYSFSLQYPAILFPGKTQFTNEQAPKNIRIHSIISSINPINWIKVGKQIKHLRPDYIIVRFWLPFMGPCFGTILRLAKKNKYSKIICLADNMIPHEKRFYDNLATRYFLKPIDSIVTMSEQVSEDVKKFTSTIPIQKLFHPLYDNFGEAIDTKDAKQSLNIETSKQVILFFGFIRPYKGVDLLVESIYQINSSHKDFFKNKIVLIAGEFYENTIPYFDKIKQYHLEKIVQFNNAFIPDEDVKKYFSAADVVIQPYRSATQSGVTPLAYHFNTPMIVTNVGGLPNMVTHKKVGLVCEPNINSIATCIQDFFTYKKDEFVNNIKEEKKKYNWKTFVEKLIMI